MKQNAIALLAGLLFGAGLAISGMSDPARVQSFLNLFGQWDPTLAFVMGGAMIPMAIAWMLQKRMPRPLACDHFDIPGTRLIDSQLIFGAVIFGTGWGIGGLCPGPAVAGLAIAPEKAGIFVIAMLTGMAVHQLTSKLR